MSTHRRADALNSLSFAPARADAARRPQHTLPTPVTNFVGRVREIAALKARLRQTRLLTITGIGGIGKSRLALEVARSVDGSVTDAVALAELATISAPEHVAGAIAIALGVQDAGQRDLMDALVVSLSARRVLLVLDNCEQVRSEVATLSVRLLQRCPDVRIVATSRAPLHAGGESIWRLGPLGAPPLMGPQSRAALARYPSVRLFIDRARRVRSDFSLTDENAQDVGRICARLDGIPLAIELAAVRVSLLSPRQIEERLDERFGILEAPHHHLPDRQATLLTVLDWSYELLPPDGRILLQRLSIFAGGFSCEAAESAWGQWVAQPLPDTVITAARLSALDLLAELVDLSLVIAEPRHGSVRYRLLETVRQDAQRRLREAGHLEATRSWLVSWLVQEAEANEARIWGGEQVAALDWFEREMDNIRVAIESREDDTDGDLGIRLGATLWWYWHIRGRIGDGRVWLSRLLQFERSDGPPQARGRLLWVVGLLALWAGEVPEARRRCLDGLPLAEGSGDFVLRTAITGLIALLDQLDGNATAGDASLARVMEAAALAASRHGQALALYHRGYLALNRGDAALGLELLERGSTMARQLDDAFLLAHFLGTLGHAALLRGDALQARRLLGEALELRQAIRSPATEAFTVEKLAWLAADVGAPLVAARLLGAASGMRAQVGTALYPYEQAGHTDAVAAARRALSPGDYEAAYRDGQELSRAEAVKMAASWALATPQSTRAQVSGGSQLSRRGWQIGRLVAGGLTNRQIAERLVLQESTVGNHLQRIYARLGLNGRAQLAAWIAEHDRAADTVSDT